MYPWNFVRTNTIYGVIHKAGGYTAWSDKHPVYAVVSGHGTSTPTNLDDYYAPEVNSNRFPCRASPPPGRKSTVAEIAASGNDWTTDFQAIQCYDQLKVNAIVNEIKGKTHLGTADAPVPANFGMNFQAVSVGQKLIVGTVKGGYTDAAGDPTPSMASEIKFVDAAIGQMVEQLEDRTPPPFDCHHHHCQARPITNRHQPLFPHPWTFRHKRDAAIRGHSGLFSRFPRPPASGWPRMTFPNCG